MVFIYGADGKIISRGISAQYDGSKAGGDLHGWTTFTTNPNDFVFSSYGTLSKRNATLYHTSSIARACVNKPLTYAIGDGLVHRSAIDADFLGINSKAAKEWSRNFTELLHYEKIESGYYEKQALLYREAKITGDSVLYFLREEDSEIPFDLIAAGGDEIDWKTVDNNHILGIFVDDYNRRSGFRRAKTGKDLMFRDADGNQNAIQFLFRERPGQIRGFGCYYSEIARAKGLDRVWDATIERMVQESVQMGYFNTSYTDPAQQAANMARQARGETPKSGELKNASSGRTEMVPGNMYVFENGESMQFTDLKTPSNNFGLANEWSLRMFAMAVGYPPEFIRGEYSTSYTAHRGGLNDAIKKYMQERNTFARYVDQVVNLEYLKYFIRSGELKVKPSFWTDHRVRRAYLSGSVLGPVPGHINPFVEAKADILADEAGYNTKSTISAKYGHDFWNTIDEWADQQMAWFNASPAQQAEQLAKNQEEDTKNFNPEETTEEKEKREEEENKNEEKSMTRRFFGWRKK
jgi:capsid protein